MSVLLGIKIILKAIRSQVYMAWTRVRLLFSPPHSKQLEIGSGPVKRAGWVTMDMRLGADYYWDFTKRLPFGDASFDVVYCSHVLEHFWYPELKSVLREVRRVLKPGGSFLIAVPDASMYVDKYVHRENSDHLLTHRPAVISSLPMDVLNYIFYMERDHRFMFDRENLRHHLREAGFTECTERAFDPGLDMAERDYESLYASCR